MHTHEYRGIEGGPWTVHHNGDYSGDVHIFITTYHPSLPTNFDRIEFVNNEAQRHIMQPLIHAPEDLEADGYAVKIPFELMKRIVAEKVRNDMIERIEDMDANELLKELMR